MPILIKGNPKRGIYKLIPTTDGYVLDGIDGDFMTYAGHEIVTCGECKYVDTDATCCLVCGRDGMGLHPYHVYRDDFCSYGKRRE